MRKKAEGTQPCEGWGGKLSGEQGTAINGSVMLPCTIALHWGLPKDDALMLPEAGTDPIGRSVFFLAVIGGLTQGLAALALYKACVSLGGFVFFFFFFFSLLGAFVGQPPARQFYLSRARSLSLPRSLSRSFFLFLHCCLCNCCTWRRWTLHAHAHNTHRASYTRPLRRLLLACPQLRLFRRLCKLKLL